ncbi:MAG TPA: hypothetical protein VGZ52_05080, partial [Acidimicrobiales bacterium]|nr:hypothetical protein [Acidimicrobiales bacterium]
RAQVAQSIEDYATGVAQMLVMSEAYAPPLTTSATRDNYCAANNGAAAPISYAFGTPTPW